MLFASLRYGCLLFAFLASTQLFAVEKSKDQNTSHADVIENDVAESNSSSLDQRSSFDDPENIAVKSLGNTQIGATVEQALAHHPLLKSLKQQVLAAQAGVKEAKAGRLPRLTLGLGVGREDSNNQSTRAQTGSGSDEYERREASLRVRQTIYDGSENRYWQKASRAESMVLKHQYMFSASEVALEAIEAHLSLMKANRVLANNIANLEAHEKIAKDVGIRARSGKDDRAKVNQISARLSLALANVELAKQSRNRVRVQYETVVGRPPESRLSYKPGLIAMPNNVEELRASVMENSPLLSAEQERVNTLGYLAKRESASLMPEVYLEAGASWNDNLDGVRGRNNDSFVMLRVDYDLFDGGARNARSKRLQKQHAQAIYSRELDVQELRSEAEQAWYDYQSLSKRQSLLQDYVEAAQNTKSAYIKQFGIGRRSLIDLLDAENELLQAKSMLADARFELRLSKFKILHLQGRLLSSS